MQIHATNINGLGASQVVKSFLQAFDKSGDLGKFTIFMPKSGLLSNFRLESGLSIKFNRILPNSISRFIECTCSRLFFSNVPTIVLGDIPLRGIVNQIILVHQPNLVYPRINSHSSKKIYHRVNRMLFAINQKYAKKIIVQTGAMAEDLIRSYPKIESRVIISPQPVPNWFNVNLKHKKSNIQGDICFFYPAAFYSHKKHDFLLKVDEYCILNSYKIRDIKVWLTLSEEEFKPFEAITWVENLGRLDIKDMNHYYSQADSLLFLSSMESYGLPIVEALSINLPILIVDLNYSRWLCEGAVEYFTPYDEFSFLEALEVQKKNIISGRKPDYDIIMKKFPNSWTEVVDLFQNSLMSI
jgi:hypothetical protein